MAGKLTNKKALSIAITAIKEWCDYEIGLPVSIICDNERFSVEDVIAKLERLAASNN